VSTTATINNYTQTFFVPDTSGTAQWVKLGTWTAAQGGNVVTVQIDQHSGYNATTGQNQQVYIYMKTSNGSSVDANGFAGDSSFWTEGTNEAIQSGDVIWEANAAGVGATAYTLYVNMGAFTNASQYTVTTRGGTWANVGTLTSPSGTTPSSTILLSENRFVVNNILTVGGAGSGNVLIGTYTDGGYKLNVNGNTQSNGIILGTDQTYGGTYRSVSFGANQNGANRIFATTDAADGMYFASATGTGFSFRPNGGTADLVKITSTGNVGIGADSPGSKLDVDRDGRTGSHATSQSLYVTGTMGGGTTGGQAGNIEFRHSNGSQGIGFGYQTIYQTGDNTNEVLNILSRGTGALTLNAYAYSSGNVLIGTSTDAGYKLDVTGNARVTDTLFVNTTLNKGKFNISGYDNGGINIIDQRTSSSNVLFYSSITFRDYYDSVVAASINFYHNQYFGSGVNRLGFSFEGSERLTILRAGNVGIGTTTPSHSLTVSRTTEAAAYQININNDGGISDGNFTGIRFSQDSSGATELGNIRLHYYSTGVTDLSFGNRYQTQALTIKNGGNVLIGTTTDIGTKLNVNGTSYISGAASFGSTIDVNGNVTLTQDTNDLIFQQTNSSTHGIVWKNTTYAKDSASIRPTGNGAWATQGIGFYTGNAGDSTTAPSLRFNIEAGGSASFTNGGGNTSISNSNDYSLQVTQSASNAGQTFNEALFLLNSNQNDSNFVAIGMSTNGTDGQHHRVSLRALRDGSVGGQFQMALREAGTSNNVVRVNVKSNGNFLIGTTTDSGYKLDVNGTALVRGNFYTAGELGIELSWTGNTLNDSRNGRIRPISTPAQNPYAGGLAFDYYKYDGSAYNWFEGMRLNGSGNVGIGTTSPAAPLHVKNPGDNGGVRYTVFLGQNSTGYQNSFVASVQDELTDLGAGIVGTNTGSNLSFSTHPNGGALTERMRITKTGNVLIGTTTDSGYKLDVVGDTRITSGSLGVGVAPNATDGRIDASNDIVAYQTSDQRLKENVTPIENALEKVKSLTGVEFDWIEEHKHIHGYEGHDTGVIAQQVQAVMPTAVRTNDSGYLSVRYEKMIALLIEGMKEQQKEIDELKKLIK
jgi:hypothetical protein